jgi:hypothetical protein
VLTIVSILKNINVYLSALPLRRMGWEGHVACIRDTRSAYRVWYGNLKERDNLEDLGIDGRVFKKWGGRVWTGLIWIRSWTDGELF